MSRTRHRSTALDASARLCTAVAAAAALASCQVPETHLPEPIRLNKQQQSQSLTLVTGEESKRTATTATQGIAPPLGRTLAEPFASWRRRA